MHDDYDHHESPPRTLREVLGRATTITGITALAVWLIAAIYAAIVVVTVASEGGQASLNFAILELGVALIALGAVGMFATLTAFLITHAARAVRPRTGQKPPPAENPEGPETPAGVG